MKKLTLEQEVALMSQQDAYGRERVVNKNQPEREPKSLETVMANLKRSIENRSKRNMNQTGIVEMARKSQSGKSVSVRVNGADYSCKDFTIENCVGQTIEFDTSSSEWNGKTIHWINEYKVSGGTAPAQQPQPQGNPAPVHANNIGMVLPFISNTVAHAIDAGLIKDALSIEQYALGCISAFNAAQKDMNPY